MFIIVGIILIIILGSWVIGMYNSLITTRERVDNAKAQIATQIESRWDAISSLISAVKQYSKHEAETLENVTAQRANVGRNSSVKDIENSEASFNNVLGRLIAVSEAYPDLKASNVYENAMNNIGKFEEHVRVARMVYNDTVTMYNRKIKLFPSSMIAGMFNFESMGYFEGTDTKQDMPSWE